MFKFGLEIELFVKQNGVLTLVPKGLPKDGCGWLVEYRSKPCSTFTDAYFSLEANEYKYRKIVKARNVELILEPVLKISPQLKRDALRIYSKDRIKYKNLYGYEKHKNTTTEATAGIHVSITNQITWDNKHPTNELFDFVTFVKYMDSLFAKEIKQAKRNPGFYEIKSDKRFEYRSLPNNVDVDKLINAVENYNFY